MERLLHQVLVELTHWHWSVRQTFTITSMQIVSKPFKPLAWSLHLQDKVTAMVEWMTLGEDGDVSQVVPVGEYMQGEGMSLAANVWSWPASRYALSLAVDHRLEWLLVVPFVVFIAMSYNQFSHGFSCLIRSSLAAE